MFDFAWSEIMLIGAVALIAIGPKDMPAAIRTVTGMIKKARRMASEFQTHVDDMVREAELGDVKQAFNDLRRMMSPRRSKRWSTPISHCARRSKKTRWMPRLMPRVRYRVRPMAPTHQAMACRRQISRPRHIVTRPTTPPNR